MRKHDAPPTVEQMDRLLAFLPVFERPDFIPAWDRQVPEELKGSFMEMEEEWAPELEAFHQAIDEEGIAFSFAWSEWQEQAAALVNQPEALAKADLQALPVAHHPRAHVVTGGALLCEPSAVDGPLRPHHPAAAAAAGDPPI